MKQDCNHDIVIKYGVAECQNCGIEESKILNQNKMEQTAVEWFFNKIKHILPNDFLLKYDQAKEMEKQQIIDFALWFNNRDNSYKSYTKVIEQYYNETFKNK